MAGQDKTRQREGHGKMDPDWECCLMPSNIYSLLNLNDEILLKSLKDKKYETIEMRNNEKHYLYSCLQ